MKVIKKLSVVVAAVLLNAVVMSDALAQDTITPDQIKKQLDILATSACPSDQQLLSERLKILSASNIEMEMAIAANYYYQMKDTKAFDSVSTAQLRKFPKGLEVRIRTQQRISLIKSLPELEKAYNEFVKDFPADSYPRLPFGEDRLPYDRLRSMLANGYAKVKNVVRATYYAGLLEADFWKVRSYGDLASTFYANDDLAHAAMYQQKAVESARPYVGGKMGNSAAASFAIKEYTKACSAYAQILFEQKKYAEALKFIEIAVNATNTPGADDNFLYAEILAAQGCYQEAYVKIESAVKSGEATGEMSEFFKFLYLKVKGSSKGLELYQADIRRGVMDRLRNNLKKNMINEQAANFVLSDLRGNRVSLAELRGKIVILDFWATWCVPCKASFPGMQMAVDKYKNDPDIKFLFIHTWERTTTPAADVKAYLDSMKYDFKVLMDILDSKTKTNQVVESYHVSSIPTKFVIDEEGNIRFKLKGFKGSKEAIVDEISTMIELIKTKDNFE